MKCKPLLLQTSRGSLFFQGRDKLGRRLLSDVTWLFSPISFSLTLFINLVEEERPLGEGKCACVRVGARDQLEVLFLKNHPPLETVSLTRAWGLPKKLSQASKALRSSCLCLPAHTGHFTMFWGPMQVLMLTQEALHLQSHLPIPHLHFLCS